jgi:putative endonuclease
MPKLYIWYVYIFRCVDNTLYTGVTTDVTRRLQEHNAQGSKTAKYLRGKNPLQLVFQLQVADKCTALKIEHKIKALSKVQKELLAAGMSASINN